MVKDHPSTAISCVAAKKLQNKNITVNMQILGICSFSPSPIQVLIFIDMYMNVIPIK